MSERPVERVRQGDMSKERRELLDDVTDMIWSPLNGDCVRVAVDGVDGSGKTMFATELSATLRRRGRCVVLVSADGFHHVRAVRYRRALLGFDVVDR